MRNAESVNFSRELETMNISPARLRDLVISRKLKWNDLPGNVNIIGVRGMANRLLTENKFDLYNDSIILISNPEKADHHLDYSLEWYPSSVDPGKVSKPNRNGTAHLLNGQYRYKIGRHRNRYPALVQAEAVIVERYFDTDKKPRLKDTGWFGINIHRGSNQEEYQKHKCYIGHGGSVYFL